jgi:hypothetical protein
VSPIETYRVFVPAYGSVLLPAPSPERARQDALKRFNETLGKMMPEGLVETDLEVKVADLPADSGYDYVRRLYGKDVEAGQRVRLTMEGRESDLEGWVVYPGQGTAYAHVWIDGKDHPSRVHPDEIEILPVLEMRL